MEDRKTLKFTCLICDSNRIEEISSSNFISSELEIISSDGDHDYLLPIINDSETLYYQCVNCGEIIKGESGFYISDCDALAEWIEEHCPQEGGENGTA